MRKVGEITRVRVNTWVQVERRDGSEVTGQVVCHHDRHPTRHTIRLNDGRNITVDFPEDRLLKVSSTPLQRWTRQPVAEKPDPAPVVPKPAPPKPLPPPPPVVKLVEVEKIVEKVWHPSLIVAFLTGAALGGIAVAGYIANTLPW